MGGPGKSERTGLRPRKVAPGGMKRTMEGVRGRSKKILAPFQLC